MVPSAWPHVARSLIAHAILAPSSHNTQPWWFRITDDAIELHADRTRALPVNDPDDRELVISCGCALFTLRVAAAEVGIGTRVAVLADAEDADLLARITPTGAPSDDLAGLSESLPRRRTYRKAFANEPVAAAVVAALEEAAVAEGARFVPLATDDARHELARLVAEGDEALWRDPRWRRELAAWMHPRRRGDGLAMPTLAVPVAQAIVRTFDMGGGTGAKDRQLAEASPLLAVLGTDGDAPADHIVAGQAMQRVLLAACAAGLQASYLNQPVQVATLRDDVARLAGVSSPQAVLRLGRPVDDVPTAPRRPVADVIE